MCKYVEDAGDKEARGVHVWRGTLYCCPPSQEEEDICHVSKGWVYGEEGSFKEVTPYRPSLFPSMSALFLSSPLRMALGNSKMHKIAEELKVDYNLVDKDTLNKLTGNRPHQVRHT